MQSDLTYSELEKLYQQGKAISINDRITSRDFLITALSTLVDGVVRETLRVQE